MDLDRSPIFSQPYYEIDRMSWDPTRRELTVGYEAVPARPQETYALNSDKWVKMIQASGANDSERGVVMSVRQDLNHPTALWVQISAAKREVLLWDPNPDFQNIRMGIASLYHWEDSKGRKWNGILALPPDYNSKRHYPLVLQTHGYWPDRFFADGYATTGYGGRALVAKDIVVLQMEDDFAHFASSEEGPDNLAGFESAINHLVADGVVDGSRVGVMGFSRTCFHVRFALVHRPKLFQAAAITDGFNPSYVSYVLDGPAVESGASSIRNSKKVLTEAYLHSGSILRNGCKALWALTSTRFKRRYSFQFLNRGNCFPNGRHIPDCVD